MSSNSHLSLCHHKGHHFDICCSLRVSPFIKGSREEERTPGNGCTCTHTHKSTFMSQYTHSLFCIYTHSLDQINKAPELKPHAQANKYKNTSLCLKERLNGIITPTLRCLAFGLKDFRVCVCVCGIRTDRVELNWLMPPVDTAKTEKCQNNWFVFYHLRWTVLLFQPRLASLAEDFFSVPHAHKDW